MPRRDDVRRLGQPRPRRLRSASSTARSTPASTSSTPPTCTRPASRRRSSARRSRRPPRRRRARHQGPRRRWATTPTSRGNSRRWIRRRSRTACAAWAPTGSTSTRSTGPTRRPTSTRRSARSPTSCTPGKVRYLGSSTFPAARRSSRRSGSAERRGRERFVCEQPPYSILARGIEADVLPTCRALRHGRDRLEPARRRLAHRAATARTATLPGAAAPARDRRSRYDLSLPGNQRQARGRRAARAARRRGRASR